MFDFISNLKDPGRKNSVRRPSLYCVWIRAHEGENAPLISIWIDPALAAFESVGQGTSSEIDTTSTFLAGHEADAADRLGAEDLHFILPCHSEEPY